MTSLKTLNQSTKINMDDTKLIKLMIKYAITSFCESQKIIRDYLDKAYCKILDNLEKKRKKIFRHGNLCKLKSKDKRT